MATLPSIHTQFNPPADPGIGDFDPSRTKQEFKEEADVNYILDQYETTGIGPPIANREPIFGDFSDPALSNYQESLRVVAGAADLFERLPAKTRERFRNNPADLILFVQDKANAKEAVELGLIDFIPAKPQEPAPGPAPAPAPAPGVTK